LALELVNGSGVKVGAVVGFPHGSSTANVKAYEALEAVENGAQELDIVINYGALRSGEVETVRDELQKIVFIVSHRALVKVILETYYLTNEEKKLACQIVEEAGGDFVKTSSGFTPRGATLSDVKLMRAAVSNHIQIKAAGKIRTLSKVLQVMDAGCSRIGTSATESILDEFLVTCIDM
jgi:deoxyribose-phosphate aldolase